MHSLRIWIVAVVSAVSFCACSDIPWLSSLTDTFSQGAGSLPKSGGVDISQAAGAGGDLVKAATLSDEEVKSIALQCVSGLDAESREAPADSGYAKRLSALTRGLSSSDGVSFNFKAYLNPEVNAISFADGSIRVYSGIMDFMNDDELRSVIGHEMGHVKLGHRKKATQVSYASAAAAKGAMSVAGGTKGELPAALLAGLLKDLVNAQFSQSQEKEADDYGLNYLVRGGYNPWGAVSAFEKLATLGGEPSMFSTHPDSKVRAARIAEEIKENKIPPPPASSSADPASPQVVHGTLTRPKSAETQPVLPPSPAAPAAAKDAPPPQAGSVSPLALRPQPATSRGALIAALNPELRRGWYVQHATAADPAEAQLKGGDLKFRGVNVQIVPLKTALERGYVVLAGPFASQPIAARILDELKAEGIATADAQVLELPEGEIALPSAPEPSLKPAAAPSKAAKSAAKPAKKTASKSAKKPAKKAPPKKTAKPARR